MRSDDGSQFHGIRIYDLKRFIGDLGGFGWDILVDVSNSYICKASVLSIPLEPLTYRTLLRCFGY